MTDTHSLKTTGDRYQCDGFTHPDASIIVCNVDERLHVPPWISTRVTPPRRLFPLSLSRKSFPRPFTVKSRRLPCHSNGWPISNRRRSLIVPCLRRFAFLCFQKSPIEVQGDFILIDIKSIKCHGMFRTLIGKPLITTHREGT